MAKTSVGLLLYRRRGEEIEVFLVHPGGPFWARKDIGAWSVPKGEPEEREDPLSAARREFREETGFEPPGGSYVELTPVRLTGGKVVRAWAAGGDCDPDAVRSNTFSMEWPPRSGMKAEFPEVDRAGWFSIEEAEKRINKAQAGLLRELRQVLSDGKLT